jgi:prepilin-type N-terminal cleavage/methylation domain-containing protein
MKRIKKHSSGFTLLELLAALTIFSILSLIAFPNFAVVRNQMRVSNDTRTVAMIISELRAEAIRLKRPVRLNFTSSTIRWDYFDDGEYDGTYTLQAGSSWVSTPVDFTFNGFGLLRGVTTDRILQIENGSIRMQLTLNTNGHLEL